MMLMSVCTRVCACVFCSELILVLRSRPASAYKVLELEACATKPFAEGCHETYFMGSLITCHPFSGAWFFQNSRDAWAERIQNNVMFYLLSSVPWVLSALIAAGGSHILLNSTASSAPQEPYSFSLLLFKTLFLNEVEMCYQAALQLHQTSTWTDQFFI